MLNESRRVCVRNQYLVIALGALLLAAGCSQPSSGSSAPGATQTAATSKTPYELINEEAASGPITVTPLRGHLSMLSGSGGNITALVGPEGQFLVDGGIALSRQKIADALRSLGTTPVRYVVNTHWHWDHTDSNAWLHEAGATLVAHPNTVRHLSETLRINEWGHTFTPVPASARPTEIVPTSRTFAFDGESIVVRAYTSPGHTDGDLSVFFTRANVLVVGDTWWNGHYPFIDYVGGGGINGVIAQADQSLSWASDDTLIVPGHGPAGSRADLLAFRNMLVDIRDRVAALKAGGATVEQAIAAHPTAAYDERWGTSLISPALFTTLVYRGV